jgi:hypothetical protein
MENQFASLKKIALEELDCMMEPFLQKQCGRQELCIELLLMMSSSLKILKSLQKRIEDIPVIPPYFPIFPRLLNPSSKRNKRKRSKWNFSCKNCTSLFFGD